MSQQPPGRGTQAIRREYGRLFDQAADLVKSFHACPCGEDAEAHRTDDEDLNAMIDDMIPARQRVGACHSLPPCDGTNLEDDLSDEALGEILARLEWNYSVLHDEVTTSQCDCADRPSIPEPEVPAAISDEERRRLEGASVPSDPPALMNLPVEIRNIIWWSLLRPRNGVVRIVPHRLDRPPLSQSRFGQSRLGGPVDHLERFSVMGYPHSDRLSRETWALLAEHQGAGGLGNATFNGSSIFRANNSEVYWEAGGEFWRRVLIDGLMLSFGPEEHSRDLAAPLGHVEYDGILSAYTFFRTLVRDDPDDSEGPSIVPENMIFTQHTHGIDYLSRIRRIHLDLSNTTMGANRQALAPDTQPFNTNAINYLDSLLDMLHDHCTGLEHLSLDFVGWVPDVSQQPWVEGPIGRPGIQVILPGQPQPVHPSSAHWVDRLTQFEQRPLNRLRLRVRFHEDVLAIVAIPAQHPSVLRAARFIEYLRSRMLTNGDRLGDTHRFWLDPTPHRNVPRDAGAQLIPRAVVELDDSWDEETQTHSHHDWNETDESDYFPP